MALATLVGWLVIAGSCVRSLPQILRILKNRRWADGRVGGCLPEGPGSAGGALGRRDTCCRCRRQIPAPTATGCAPRLLRCHSHCSVRGLSLTSFLSETAAYGISLAYNTHFNYPFSTWGDTAMCWLQNVAIVGLILLHGCGVLPPPAGLAIQQTR
jgi:hypothetical protein